MKSLLFLNVESASCNIACPLQIKREISTMKLIRHPNVIRMYEVSISLLSLAFSCLIPFPSFLSPMKMNKQKMQLKRGKKIGIAISSSFADGLSYGPALPDC